MRGLVRASAYLPPNCRDGCRVAGPDEDPFTLLATALERAVAPFEAPASRPAQLEVVGRFPSHLDWAVGAFRGSVAPLHRRGEGGPALVSALADAAEGSGGETVVLASELPERVPAPSAPPAAPGAGSVAFVFREGGGEGIAERLGRIRVEPSAMATAWALHPAASEARSEVWVGDWGEDPSLGRPIDLRRLARFIDLEPTAVSEGAYVPRPRYLESLPSRWKFLAQRCPRCSQLTFPARGACRRCGAREGLMDAALPRDGALVIASTVIGRGGQPTEFDPQVEVDGGYGVVLAELSPGIRVTLQLADADPGQVRVGHRVDTRLRRLYPMEGEWRYGRKAVPRGNG